MAPGFASGPPSTLDAARPLWGTAALEASRNLRRARQQAYAEARDAWIHRNQYYYDIVARLLQSVVEPGARVLELRCSSGYLLQAMRPARGVGVEITSEMVEVARRNHPDLEFIRADPELLDLDETFDYILFSHAFDTVDVMAALRRLRACCTPHTRLIVYNYNHLWQPLLDLATRLGLRTPFAEPNWLSAADLQGLLELAGFELLRVHRAVLLPVRVPVIAGLLNRVAAALPVVRRLCMVEMLVARPVPRPRDASGVTVSVIVPCKDERDNIEPAALRIPDMGARTEILFCDDRSTDGTGDEIRRIQALFPHRAIRLIQGPGISKAENVWAGFRAARGDVLMILDGDLSVMPEELPHFFSALVEGTGELVNGSRLVYPMQDNAMKTRNLIGNKLFSVAFSYLLDQRIKDTLCGTKVLWRRDWQRIERLLGTWGVRDLWGDYELLLGASRLQLCIRDLPVHYQDRVYGTTKMTRVFANGLRMLRLCWAAWWTLKARA